MEKGFGGKKEVREESPYEPSDLPEEIDKALWEKGYSNSARASLSLVEAQALLGIQPEVTTPETPEQTVVDNTNEPEPTPLSVEQPATEIKGTPLQKEKEIVTLRGKVENAKIIEEKLQPSNEDGETIDGLPPKKPSDLEMENLVDLDPFSVSVKKKRV